jgi:hypothetical protein
MLCNLKAHWQHSNEEEPPGLCLGAACLLRVVAILQQVMPLVSQAEH